MDPGFKFMVMVAFTYLIFLCVVRLVLGKQYKAKSFLIDIIGILVVFGSFIISKYNNILKLPGYLHYALPIALTVLLPPLALRMKSHQVLKYLALSILAVPFVHIVFSFFVGWGDLLPFIRIPSLWTL
ncbi:MAG: hypothetical protein GX384_01790 [Clostridiaceae bacterium]|nr:hypothetical protein [Bacillota bacterium]NLI38064.1 hypothetical protein [Clostridiaceae bacterium]